MKLLVAVALALIPGSLLIAADQRLSLTPENTTIEWTLADTLHTVHGSFRLKRGFITFDTDTGKASGEVTVDVKSGESGNRARDSRMHDQVLESSKYPEAVFTPHRIEGKLAVQGVSSLKLHGAFQIHGAVHEAVMNVAVKISGAEQDTQITFDLPYIAWGMKDPGNFLLKVGKAVQLSIHTTAIPQP